MALVNQLTKEKDLIVLATIHQPSAKIYNSFHQAALCLTVHVLHFASLCLSLCLTLPHRASLCLHQLSPGMGNTTSS